MAKISKKKLEARLVAAEASLHDLESARAVHDEFVVSTMDELARFGEGLAAVRADLETATGEIARFAAALRDRGERLHAVEARLQEAKVLADVLEARALQAESGITDLQARLHELRLASAEELGAARGRERLSEDRLRTVQRQLSDALKRLRDAPAASGRAEGEDDVAELEVDQGVDPEAEDPEGGESLATEAEDPEEGESLATDAEDPRKADAPVAASGEGEDALSYERVWESFRREAGSDEEDDPGA